MMCCNQDICLVVGKTKWFPGAVLAIIAIFFAYEAHIAYKDYDGDGVSGETLAYSVLAGICAGASVSSFIDLLSGHSAVHIDVEGQ